jgi:hypothetical protein
VAFYDLYLRMETTWRRLNSTCGGGTGSTGGGGDVGNTGESGRDHFLPPSQLAVISIPKTLTVGCSSSCGLTASPFDKVPLTKSYNGTCQFTFSTVRGQQKRNNNSNKKKSKHEAAKNVFISLVQR